jgi:hypothetical protein
MKSAFLPVAAACLLVVGTTIVQGWWTDRWTNRNVAEELRQSAALLEERFPKEFGGWEFVQELPTDMSQLERAGAVGHVSRLYRDTETNVKVSAFVVCATPHDASGHTPDRCYPGAGFEIAEAEHRQSLTLSDGRKAEAFTGTFRKTGQTLRVYWTYGGDGAWIAPQIARIELAGRGAVYKLYAIIDETSMKDGQAQAICTDFLAAALPEIDRLVGFQNPGAERGATVEASASR